MTDLPADKQQIIAQIERAIRLSELIAAVTEKLEMEYGMTDLIITKNINDLSLLLRDTLFNLLQ
ncbi:MAG: hypothetical protein B6D44_15060 [Ignavibacteriales bacterium UTCHB2]|jgi:hypothetical protein|nr:MAG: hypothetical protein B6D44_15060 [Ignavibacteriales bacterium UTCHB2]